MIETEAKSMRENLIFKGIPDVTNYKDNEDTEAKKKAFIQ